MADAASWDEFSDPVPDEWDSPLWSAEGGSTTPTGLAVAAPEGGDELVPWGGMQIPKSRIIAYAEQTGRTPENVMRLGTPQGRFESAIAKTAIGQTMLRAEQGLTDLAYAGLSLAGRAGLLDVDSEKAHEDQFQREAYLKWIEEGGDIESALGETGSRIYGSVVRNTGKMAAAATAGPVALYSAIGGESFDNALNTATKNGLAGGEAVLYAGKTAGTELAVTFLMGRAMQRLGIRTLEESLAPTTRREAARVVEKLGLGPKITEFVKHLGGAGSEYAEESITDGIQQYVDISEGFQDGFDIAKNLEAGTTGLLSAGAASAVQSIQETLTKAQPQIEARVQAMADVEPVLKNASADEVQDLASLDDTALKAKIGKLDADPAYLDAVRDQVNDRIASDNEMVEAAYALKGGDPAPQNAVEAVSIATDSPALAPAPAAVSPVVGVEVEGGTRAKNESMKRDAELLDLHSYFSPGVKDWATTQAEAREKGIPGRAYEIAQRSLKENIPLTHIEQAGLTIRFADLKRQSIVLSRQLTESTDPTFVRDAGAQFNRLDSESQTIIDALGTSRTEAGRTLVFGKFAVDDDFSPVSVIARAKSAKRDNLSGSDESYLRKLAGEDASLQMKLDTKSAEVRAQQAFKILQDTNAEAGEGSSIVDLYRRAEQLFKGGCDF